jgi:hypothetical protein
MPMPPFEKHVFICTNRRDPSNPKGSCAYSGSEAICDAFKSEVASAGLRVVIMVGKRLASDGGAIALCGLNPSVREVFDIAGFSSLFPIHPDRARAVAALAGRSRLGGIGRMADRLLHRRGEPAGPMQPAARSVADPARVALAAEILSRGTPPRK